MRGFCKSDNSSWFILSVFIMILAFARADNPPQDCCSDLEADAIYSLNKLGELACIVGNECFLKFCDCGGSKFQIWMTPNGLLDKYRNGLCNDLSFNITRPTPYETIIPTLIKECNKKT